MSHIHISDGVISAFWGLGGYLIVGFIMFFILKKIKETDLKRKVPMTGVVAALMLIGMSVPLGPLPIHLSLAVLSGIIAGPALGFIAVFVVNFLLAFFGHGGMTIVGLNTLIVGAEVFVGSLLFRLLSKKLTAFKSASIATAIGVITSMALMIGLIGVSTGGYEAIADKFGHHHHKEEVTHHENHEDHHLQQEDRQQEHHHDEEQDIEDVNFLFLSGWAAIIIILLLGIFIESMGTGLIVKFFNKIRPDITNQSNSTVTDK
ncbi:MAG: hypothetical protein GX387_11725 [Clostridium sp.]|jgi:cobalt/nickel transport system permease protein|nr:hypothetical protein [Clostridium sp.]